MPEFYIIIARKIFSTNFRGDVSPLPPVSMGENYFSVNYLVKFDRLLGIYHAKFGNFADSHTYIFGQKCLAPKDD